MITVGIHKFCELVLMPAQDIDFKALLGSLGHAI